MSSQTSLRSLSTFMAGVPHLERGLTTAEETVDVDLEIKAFQLHCTPYWFEGILTNFYVFNSGICKMDFKLHLLTGTSVNRKPLWSQPSHKPRLQ